MMLCEQSRLHSVDKSVSKLILFRDFTRYTRIAFVEVVECIQMVCFITVLFM
jgi:hypothetical protein